MLGVSTACRNPPSVTAADVDKAVTLNDSLCTLVTDIGTSPAPEWITLECEIADALGHVFGDGVGEDGGTSKITIRMRLDAWEKENGRLSDAGRSPTLFVTKDRDASRE